MLSAHLSIVTAEGAQMGEGGKLTIPQMKKLTSCQVGAMLLKVHVSDVKRRWHRDGINVSHSTDGG
jgi:hypothetical protein